MSQCSQVSLLEGTLPNIHMDAFPHSRSCPSIANWMWLEAYKKLETEWNTVSIMPQALIDILEEQSATGEADLEADINKVEEDDVVDNIIDVIFQPDEAEAEVCLRCRRQLSVVISEFLFRSTKC